MVIRSKGFDLSLNSLTDSVRRRIEITLENLYADIIKGLTSGNSSSSSSSFWAQSSTRCASSLSRKITDDGLPINLEYGIEKAI